VEDFQQRTAFLFAPTAAAAAVEVVSALQIAPGSECETLVSTSISAKQPKSVATRKTRPAAAKKAEPVQVVDASTNAGPSLPSTIGVKRKSVKMPDFAKAHARMERKQKSITDIVGRVC
jgi:hypothetical protein